MTVRVLPAWPSGALNESPSEKEGKLSILNRTVYSPFALNESPSEKEGK